MVVRYLRLFLLHKLILQVFVSALLEDFYLLYVTWGHKLQIS